MSPDTAPPPRLLGAAEPPPARRDVNEADVPSSASTPRTRALRGLVVGRDGEPVAGARVFLLPKAPEVAAVADDPPPGPPRGTRTNADGSWDLGQQVVPGHWLGAVAEGHLPAHLDGDALPAADVLRLVLDRGPTIGIRVQGTDGGALELDTAIFIEPKGDAVAWPAPGATWMFRQQAEIPAGSQELRLPVSTTGEVVISARYHHTWWIVDPDDPVVVPPVHELVFTVSRSCVIDFRVLDAESGDPLPRGFQYTMRKDGKAVTGGMTLLPGGRMRLTTGVRPGVYTLVVSATSYRPQESRPVTLTRAGEAATVEVRLERDPTRGNIRLSLPVLGELPRRVTPGGVSRAPPAFFHWRRAPASSPQFEREFATPRTWGSLDGEVRRESDTDYVFEGVPAGEVALLVGEAVSNRVAYVPRITIRGAQADTTTVDLLLGIRFHAAALLPAKGKIRSFRIRHPVHGELPIFSFGVTSSYWLEPGEVPLRDWRLGPYPGPEIEVEVIDEDGKVMKRKFRVSER